MAMVQNVQKIHCGIFADVFGPFGVDEVPGAAEVTVGNVNRGVKV